MKRFPFLVIASTFCASAWSAPERTAISLPPAIQEQFLMNMRDHLKALSEIQEALAEGDFERASETAKNRLGLGAASSSACRMEGSKMQSAPMDNSALSKFMPEEMHRIGFRMHSAADRFAIDAEKAALIHDYREAMKSLSMVTKQCVACHSSYKLSGR